jgi:hypothetical protein
MAGIIAALGQAGIGGGSIAEKLTNNVFGGAALKAAQAAKARRAAAGAAAQAPSVVQTAGATNMGQRINTIESRLQALEGSGVSAGAAQPIAGAAQPIAEVAPQETQADINISNQPQAVMNSVIPTAQPQAAASEELGSLMASPFTMRQRANMGPLMFKD